MLHGAGNAAGDIELGGHDLAGLSHLMGPGDPTGLDDGAGGAHHAAQQIGQFLHHLEVLGAAHATAAGHNDVGALQIDLFGISLAYAKIKDAPEQNMPQPDFLLCCNNICNCMIKWYENLSKELHIPMIMIDIPFNPDYEVSDAQVAYVRDQFWAAIHQLEELTGKKWSDEKYKQVMEYSGRTSRAWLAATACARYEPSPFNGFDLLNHMAVMVTARGKKEAAEAMETLLKEYEENHEKGVSTYRGEEKYRIMFEGIACWPYLRATSTGLKSRGINMVTTIYADAFGFIYKDFDDMCRAYCNVPNAMNLEHSRDKRIKLCKDNHVEGLLVHTNRSCKLWSGFMYEMSRQIGKECNIPVSSFDGDQADPRNFSEAQYDTRVQGLTEIMEANKEAK